LATCQNQHGFLAIAGGTNPDVIANWPKALKSDKRAVFTSPCGPQKPPAYIQAKPSSCNPFLSFRQKSSLKGLCADVFWKIIAAVRERDDTVGVYTTLEGQINYRGRLPRDNLGVAIIYQGVQFLNREGLLHLNRYMAVTFLDGAYDENCFTLDVDPAILREALSDFRGCSDCRNIMVEPFTHAIEWLEAREDGEQRMLSYSVS
jgi:hypothetical protein